jgi:hypothetical protein
MQTKLHQRRREYPEIEGGALARVHSICRDSFSRSHNVRAFAPLLLLCLLQASAVAPPQGEARKRLSDATVSFTPDAFIQSVIAKKRLS